MFDTVQRAHEIALHATDAKISALLNESARAGKSLSFDYYTMYKSAFSEAIDLVKKDYPDSNN